MARSKFEYDPVGRIQDLSKKNGISYEDEYKAVQDFIHINRTDPCAVFHKFHLKYFGDTEPDPVEWHRKLWNMFFSHEYSEVEENNMLIVMAIAGSWPKMQANVPKDNCKGVLFGLSQGGK